MRKIIITLVTLLVNFNAYANELTSIKETISKYTFQNEVEENFNEELNNNSGLFYVLTDKMESERPKAVSFVALKTATSIFKSIQLGGAIHASAKAPGATLNVVASW